LQGAIDALRPWVVSVSPVYETAPWGPVPQDDYLNAIVLADDVGATPRDWLARVQQAEQAAGRTRDVRWGPRTLDVDVVAVDDVRSDDPELTLPHPRAHERAFVLVPWLDIDPQAELGGEPIAQLVEKVDRSEVRRTNLELS
jgi:2-amino-4-hydroxy-6-hydroxymethyldihydropteridine diphosphokinase